MKKHVVILSLDYFFLFHRLKFRALVLRFFFFFIRYRMSTLVCSILCATICKLIKFQPNSYGYVNKGNSFTIDSPTFLCGRRCYLFWMVFVVGVVCVCNFLWCVSFSILWRVCLVFWYFMNISFLHFILM